MLTTIFERGTSMMEWLFSVTLTDPHGWPITANIVVKNAGSDLEARRAIVHEVVARGGQVTKIEEPHNACDPIYMQVGEGEDEDE